MSYLDWKVGDRVVFVGYPGKSGMFPNGGKQIKRVPFLDVGQEYTIMDMCVRPRYATGRWAGPSIFVGFVDAEHGSVWHHHSGFRKVQPRKTDISIFTAMLDGTKTKVPA